MQNKSKSTKYLKPLTNILMAIFVISLLLIKLKNPALKEVENNLWVVFLLSSFILAIHSYWSYYLTKAKREIISALLFTFLILFSFLYVI